MTERDKTDVSEVLQRLRSLVMMLGAVVFVLVLVCAALIWRVQKGNNTLNDLDTSVTSIREDTATIREVAERVDDPPSPDSPTSQALVVLNSIHQILCDVYPEECGG